MRTLLDTNIIVDVALERYPYFRESEGVLVLVEQSLIIAYISATTFSDLYYIIRKERGREWTIEFLRQLATFCQIASVDETAIQMALNSTMKDFEDAIQYCVASLNNLEAIVTRNPKDFDNISLPVLTPAQLIQTLSETK
ncbi:MAG: PIN domain-containing protein [Coleofasciculaceae cyanobacterium SM2_1_6]|nr:PIN domain-containing protein [Coleofasciculaceae cyanobacterium SM2_1_6]